MPTITDPIRCWDHYATGVAKEDGETALKHVFGWTQYDGHGPGDELLGDPLTALELGCGRGNAVAALALKGIDPTGIDLSDTQYQAAGTALSIVEAFVDAASSGRTERLVALLTDDATGISDGAGLGLAEKAGPVLDPGADRQRGAGRLHTVSGQAETRRWLALDPCRRGQRLPGHARHARRRVLSVVIMEIRDDKIAGVRGIAAPDRLGRLNEEWQRQEHDVPLIESW